VFYCVFIVSFLGKKFDLNRSNYHEGPRLTGKLRPITHSKLKYFELWSDPLVPERRQNPISLHITSDTTDAKCRGGVVGFEVQVGVFLEYKFILCYNI
jgi:hypothetical protein